VAKVKNNLKSFESERDKKENKFFNCVAKWNPKIYDGKEGPVVLEERIRLME